MCFGINTMYDLFAIINNLINLSLFNYIFYIVRKFRSYYCLLYELMYPYMYEYILVHVRVYCRSFEYTGTLAIKYFKSSTIQYS